LTADLLLPFVKLENIKMKKIHYLLLLCLAVLFVFSCTPKKQEQLAAVHICGNIPPAGAVIHEKPHFKDLDTVRYFFGSYHPFMEQSKQRQIISAAINAWSVGVGKVAIEVYQDADAHVVFNWQSEKFTAPEYLNVVAICASYQERPRALIDFNLLEDWTSPAALPLFAVSVHETGHAFGLADRPLHDGSAMTGIVSGIPDLVPTSKDFERLANIGYKKLEPVVLCRLKNE